MGHTKTDAKLDLDGPEFVSTSERHCCTAEAPGYLSPYCIPQWSLANHSLEMGVCHSYTYCYLFIAYVCIPKECIILICIFWISQKWYHTLGTLLSHCLVLCLAVCPWCWVELQSSLFRCCIVFHCVPILPVFFIPVVVNGHLGCRLLSPLLTDLISCHLHHDLVREILIVPTIRMRKLLT